MMIKRNINKKITNSLFSLMAMTCYLATQNAYAATVQRTVATKEQSTIAFEAAVTDVKHRLAQIKPNMRLSYIRTRTEKGGVPIISKFNPQGLSGGIWTFIAPEGREAKQGDDSALLLLEKFDLSKVKLKTETDKTWTFEMPALFEREVKSEEITRKTATEMTKVIIAELEVTKQEPHFKSSRLYSTASFNPRFMVKVSNLNVHNVYSEAWPSGPLVINKLTKQIEGRIGLLVGINDDITEIHSDFKLIEISH
jgi:hypothetical protein